MNGDNLRDQLAEVAAREDHARAVDSGSAREAEWSDLTASDKRSWLDYEIADALMSVVREALAQARAEALDGVSLELADCENDCAGLLAERANQWRQEQP